MIISQHLMSDRGKCNIVIENGHFRLKITGVSRPILLYCASTCVFSEPMPTVEARMYLYILDK